VTQNLVSENAPRVRKNFSKIPGILEIPNLIEIQKQSFERFLQTAIEPEKRENTGLQAVFHSSSRSRTSTTPRRSSSSATRSKSPSTTCRSASSGA
jgi:DNA-directed RNA polymerase beta subunit